MDWIKFTEERRNLLITGTVILCLATLAVTSRRDPFGFDLFWHLRTGLDWLNAGLSPWIDHYSFTYYGEAISSQPFMFQVAIAWLTQHFGLEPGVQIFRFLSFVLVFTLVFLFLRRLKVPVTVHLLILPLLVVILQFRAITRPELLSYSLCALSVMLYHRANGRISFANMAPMLFLMLFWSNYHNSIFGYIVFFGFFLDTAIRQIKQKNSARVWVIWLFWGLALVAVGFLNPTFQHPILLALGYDSEWRQLISEYQPGTLYRTVPPIYGLLTIVACALTVAVINRRWGYIFVILFLSYYSLLMVRLVTPSSIVILCIFASLLGTIDVNRWLYGATSRIRIAAGLAVGLIFAVSLSHAVGSARAIMEENKITPFKWPDALVEYVRDNKMSGRIFNDFGAGGYLIYQLSPGSQVYIDGRTVILYPLEHYKRFLDARNSPQIMREEMEKYDIALAVLKADQRAFSNIYDSGLLSLDFFDASYALFKRGDSNFPVSGRLLAYPACWDMDLLPAIDEERGKAHEILPAYSVFLPYLELITNYGKTADAEKVDFLENIRHMQDMDLHRYRFAAYQSLSRGLNQDAIDYFAVSNKWDLGELLALAIANMRLGRWAQAEKIVNEASFIGWPNVNSGQVRLLYRILEVLRENTTLTLIPNSYIEQQRQNVISMGFSPAELELDIRLLCNEPPKKL